MTADEAQRTTLEKVRVLQRKLYRAAKAQPQRTFGVLFDKVCSLAVLWVAWEQVRRNRGAAGVDGETIETIEAKGTLQFLLELREELRQQRKFPQCFPARDRSQYAIPERHHPRVCLHRLSDDVCHHHARAHFRGIH